MRVSGDAARYSEREVVDDFVQPRALFEMFDDGQKARLFSNIAAAMAGVPENIVERQMAIFEAVSPAYAAGVRAALAESGTTYPAS